MAVVTVQRLRPITGEWDSEGKRSYTDLWLVETDDENDHSPTVLDASGLPAFSTSLSAGNSTDTTVFLESRSADLVDEENSFKVWHVTCTYSTLEGSGGGGGGGGGGNPWDEAPEIAWGFTTFSKALQKDERDDAIANGFSDAYTTINGGAAGKNRTSDAVCNVLGEPFDPPYEVEEFVQTLTIQRNELQFLDTTITTVTGGINNAPLFGRPKGTVRMAGAGAARQRHGEIFYWAATYEFHIKSDTWNIPALNIGWNESDGGDPPGLVPIKDHKLEAIDTPKLLDIDGKAIRDPDNRKLVVANQGDDAILIPFFPHRFVDFGPFGFENAFFPP